MDTTRIIHPDFLFLLELKEQPVIKLFKDLRAYILEIYPDSNELLYHTDIHMAITYKTDLQPTAMEYYPKVGFAKEDRGFSIPRVK